MEYIDTQLFFIPAENSAETLSRSLGDAQGIDFHHLEQVELLGINLRLGNQPMVYNLKRLYTKTGKALPPESSLQTEQYLVVHAISAIRTKGKAKVDELQYFATALAPATLQTFDLIPKTRFNQIIQANLNLTGALDLNGEVSLQIPPLVSDMLLSEFIDIGAGMQIQLSAAAGFIGKFNFSVQIPIVQSAGIGSNNCTWILNPNENKTPLLGDQLLVQTISVPMGCKLIRYRISGAIKADKGIFWKQHEQKTPEYIIDLKLD